MIVVTGNQRSGTSMWMQIFNATGFPIVGEKFSKNWELSIKDANPDGFFESPFRNGIHYGNNPNRYNGSYLEPNQHLYHTVKIFPKGLIKTELVYLHRVIGTIRHWKEYCQSRQSLYLLESANFDKSNKDNADYLLRRELFDLTQNHVHPALTWWNNNYILLRNAETRKFPFFCVSYDSLLQQPQTIIPQVLQWCLLPQKNDALPIWMKGKHPAVQGLIDNLNIEAGIAIVNVDNKHQRLKNIDNVHFDFEDEVSQTFEDLYDCIHNFKVITSGLLNDMNKCHKLIEPYLEKKSKTLLQESQRIKMKLKNIRASRQM